MHDDPQDFAVLSSAFCDPDSLPIRKLSSKISYTVQHFQTTVICSVTGSGKSTQVPTILHESGWSKCGIILVTQPRKVAATALAIRVADELGSVLGSEVGYSVRFDDRTSPSTRIKFITDGLLIREILYDPLLTRYSVIMIDDFHDRTLHTDIVASLLRRIAMKRHELRIIVSSATLDAGAVASFFRFSSNELVCINNAPLPDSPGSVAVVHVPDRRFPITPHYLDSPCTDFVSKTIYTVESIHATMPEGDVLVFMTGRDEVERVCGALSNTKNTIVMKLYAGLPLAQQHAVFGAAPIGTRKIVVATNVAETSLTIDGIAYVVDCGRVKTRVFDHSTAKEVLAVVPISKASANQRAGNLLTMTCRTNACRCSVQVVHERRTRRVSDAVGA